MKKIMILLSLVTLILSACGTAASTPTTAPATKPPAASPPVQPPPATTAPPAQPTGKAVSGNGVEFTIPTGLGTAATNAIIPEALPQDNSPDQGHPAYLQFKLQGYPVAAPDEFQQAQVQVFLADANVITLNGDTGKIKAINAAPGKPLTQADMPQSYLIMASNLKPLASADGSVKGARMLALHGNGLPVAANDGNLAYQFHGLTADGKYYVIVQLPVTAPLLPADANAPVPTGGVPFPANGDIQVYYQQVAGVLNAAETSGQLAPSLAAMDALVQSLKINGAAVTLPALLPTATPGAAAGCQDQATFKGEEDPKDGATFGPGVPVVKAWSIYNTGTCTWDSNYNWVFVSGDQMGGTNVNLANAVNVTNGVVPPGGPFVTFMVNLTTPAAPGKYTGYWSLMDGAGKVVPLMHSANNALSVNLVVK